jgi:adenylosuccinate synthase
MDIHRVILLGGPICGGKSSVAAELLSEFGYHKISSSNFLRKQLGAALLTENERTLLQNAGDQLDEETDYRWVVDQVALPTVAANSDQKLWLFDAARKPRQVEHFRKAFGQALLHCHIAASEAALRKRYEERTSSVDTPYSVACAHPNEIAARALSHLADEIFLTDELSAREIARRIDLL